MILTATWTVNVALRKNNSDTLDEATESTALTPGVSRAISVRLSKGPALQGNLLPRSSPGLRVVMKKDAVSEGIFLNDSVASTVSAVRHQDGWVVCAAKQSTRPLLASVMRVVATKSGVGGLLPLQGRVPA